MRVRVRREKKFRRRRRGALLLALVGVLAALLFVFWSWVDAQARAALLISSVLEVPVLTPAAEAVSGEPRPGEETVAGNPALVVKPAGEGPWPAVFFVNGTVPEGRELPEARRLAEGFARAGYLVVLPDLPGLTGDRITPETVAETAEVARAVSNRPDAADGEVSMVGISTGATLALLAAERPGVGDRVSLVAGVAPYSDIRTVLNVATTGRYERVKKDLESFSPLAGTGRVRAPVEVATGPRDKYFPASEARNLDTIAPDLRVTVTPAIDHADLELSLEDAGAFAGFDAFVVRSLREARLEE